MGFFPASKYGTSSLEIFSHHPLSKPWIILILSSDNLISLTPDGFSLCFFLFSNSGFKHAEGQRCCCPQHTITPLLRLTFWLFLTLPVVLFTSRVHSSPHMSSPITVGDLIVRLQSLPRRFFLPYWFIRTPTVRQFTFLPHTH